MHMRRRVPAHEEGVTIGVAVIAAADVCEQRRLDACRWVFFWICDVREVGAEGTRG